MDLAIANGTKQALYAVIERPHDPGKPDVIVIKAYRRKQRHVADCLFQGFIAEGVSRAIMIEGAPDEVTVTVEHKAFGAKIWPKVTFEPGIGMLIELIIQNGQSHDIDS